ncbi:hypothetical protein IT412_03035 [Candidatus Peregrinibacteria bacterium]|nr:hypothetical protein [Candidatus Peregrinibacteria bacterium]
MKMRIKDNPGLESKLVKKTERVDGVEKFKSPEEKVLARTRMLAEIEEFRERVYFEDDLPQESEKKLKRWFYGVWDSGEIEMNCFENLFKLGGVEAYIFLAEILEENMRYPQTHKKLRRKDKLDKLKNFLDKAFNYRGASMARVQANPAVHNARMIDSYHLAKENDLDQGFLFERIFSAGAPAFSNIDSLDIARAFAEMGNGMDDYVIADMKVFGLTERQVVDLLLEVGREFGLSFFALEFEDKDYLVKRLIAADKLDEEEIREMAWQKWDLSLEVRAKLVEALAR